MKVLVYVREWSKKYYTDLLKRVFEEPTIVYYSDFRGLGNVWTGSFIYNQRDKGFLCTITDEEIKDIVHRCRFLRSLPLDKSKELVISAFNGINQLFENEDFDCVLMPIIDCYTLDIIERVAKKHSVPVISFVQNFIRGYSRFTLRGERIDLRRTVEDQEVSRIINLLTSQDYKPAFSLNKEVNKVQIFKRCVRDILKYKLYIPIRMTIERDQYNYRYNTKGSYNYFRIIKSIREAQFSFIKDIKFEKYCNAIYIPLHYTPESTVDYWCDSFSASYYEDCIMKIISDSPRSILFIIKEHPAMYGNRNPSFYNKLKTFNNTILIHPYENSNQLLDIVDTVGVHTGSVGVEALLRNKRVLCFTNNYYSDIHPNAHVVESITKETLNSPIKDYDNHIFIKNLLDGLFPFKYSASWNVYEASDDIDKLAYWCKVYLSNLRNQENDEY